MTAPKTRKVKLPSGEVIRTYDWADIARTYIEVTDDPSFTPKRSEGALAYCLKGWRRGDGFYGASAEEVRSLLRGGYDLPQLDESIEIPTSMEARQKRRRRSDDSSGEFDYVEYMNGEAEYYRTKDRFVPKPGINVEFTLCYSSGTASSLIAGYARWVGEAIRTLQAEGYDVALSCSNSTTDTMTNEARTTTRIIFSRFGEVSFEHDWSVIFSPGGYRHLVFLTKCLPEERERRAVSPGLGSPAQTDEWSVKWDADSRTLNINCPQQASGEFPDHDMTTQLAEITDRL